MEQLHRSLQKRHKWYAYWHSNPRSHLYHWLIFLTIALLTAVFLYTYFQTLDEEITSISSPLDTITNTNATGSASQEQFSADKMEQGQLDPGPLQNQKDVKGVSSESQDVLAAQAVTVTILTPQNNTKVDQNAIQIAASTLATSQISSIVVKIDGTVVKTCTNAASCSFWYNFSKYASGTHAVQFLATTVDGKTGQATVGVCKSGGPCEPINPTPTSKISVTPTNGNVDTTPPTITISNPKNNATITQSSTTIISQAADSSGIANMKVYVDSSLRTTCQTNSCSYNWPTGTVSNGKHTIKVTATDKANPANTATLTITITNAVPTPTINTQPTNPVPTTPPNTGARPKITAKHGGAPYVNAMNAALNQIQQHDPRSYSDILKYITEITELECAPNTSCGGYSWGGSHVISIHFNYLNWDAATIIHEMTHVKNWFTNNFPVYGCAGEAKSLTAAANYLDLIGDHSTAQIMRNYIGNWC